jgi:N-alpha-acetyl-L-2,4-diaminobutyrate deacetylase
MSETVAPSLDLSMAGKNKGYLVIGDSTKESGWANFHVPIITIKNGNGPTILVIAGKHGDEYESQFAAIELARNLMLDEIRGRVIVIPCLSQAASKEGTRLRPNGANFNSAFPGDENGSVSDKLAHFISTELFPISNSVMDMNSGGRGICFIPSSHMVWSTDVSQRAKKISSMISWNTSHHMIFSEQPGTNPASLLLVDPVRQGKNVYTNAFGGAGVATYEAIKVAKDELRNALAHSGVLNATVKNRVELGLFAPMFLTMRGSKSYAYANDTRVYEDLISLGETVFEGEPVGLIHKMDHPSAPAIPVFAPQTGVRGVMRGFPRVTIGDVVAVVRPGYASPYNLPA